jgi:hypothetical protein
MKRKMHALALAGNVGTGLIVGAARRVPSLASMYAMAVPKKPLPAWLRNSRRDCP